MPCHQLVKHYSLLQYPDSLGKIAPQSQYYTVPTSSTVRMFLDPAGYIVKFD